MSFAILKIVPLPVAMTAISCSVCSAESQVKLHIEKFEMGAGVLTYSGTQHIGIENNGDQTAMVTVECSYYGPNGEYSDGNGRNFEVPPHSRLDEKMIGTGLAEIVRANCELDFGDAR